MRVTHTLLIHDVQEVQTLVRLAEARLAVANAARASQAAGALQPAPHLAVVAGRGRTDIS